MGASSGRVGGMEGATGGAVADVAAPDLESVGRVAASVTHDLNNVLSLIKGYAHLVRSAVSHDTDLVSDLDELLDAVDRGADLARKLLAYAHACESRAHAELNPVIRSVVDGIGAELPDDIELFVHLDPAAGRVRLAAGELERVAINLILNARDAMPDGGTLELATRPGPNDGALLVVSDTGTGMDVATIRQIFRAFYTTRAERGAAGLGLTIVRSILAQSGGTIDVESAPGVGTMFTVSLPGVTPSVM